MANEDASPAQQSMEHADGELRLRNYVCAISGGPGDKAVGTGILIGVDRVLTCAHVLAAAAKGSLVDGRVMASITCEFDNYKRDGGRQTLSVKAIAERPLDWSPYFEDEAQVDGDTSEPSLDYAVFRLQKCKYNCQIGEQEIVLDDGETEPRGWLRMADAGDFDTKLETRLISHPLAESMRFAMAGKMVPVAGGASRWHYKIDSDKGSSGGLVYCVSSDGSVTPLALHSGKERAVVCRNSGRREITKFGTSLKAIQDNFDPKGLVMKNNPKANRLKLEIVIASQGGPDRRKEFLDELPRMFEKEPLSQKFLNLKYIPLIRQRKPTEVRLRDLCQLDEDHSLNQLDRVAQADLVFMFATSEDCANARDRDRLISAYGYLVARLGQRRVQLIYPSNLPDDVSPFTDAAFASPTFVHRYENSIDECAEDLKEVLDRTKEELEDERGFFELAAVALGNTTDKTILGSEHFYAESTLHILGMRFGNLANRLPLIFDQLLSPPENLRASVTIAFPGAEVWEHNRGWLEQIQGGGKDTIRFLKAVDELANSKSYGEDILKRVNFVAINEIPT